MQLLTSYDFPSNELVFFVCLILPIYFSQKPFENNCNINSQTSFREFKKHVQHHKVFKIMLGHA